MTIDSIVIKGAQEHNLKNVDLIIPRNQLVVFTGVSGSGKSSLAFDTIYAEGQRRYVESLSAYARQFLGRLEKPNVEYIEGLSPSISIDQKGVSNNPRSTVGTVTEIYDYLRLLFARIGKPYCPHCGEPVQRQSLEQITDSILSFESELRMLILAPVIKDRKGEHKDILDDIRQKGFIRVRIDGEIKDLSETFELKKNFWHSIDVVVDRLITGPEIDRSRLYQSVETAVQISNGVVIVAIQTNNELVPAKNKKGGKDSQKEMVFSENFSCPYDQINFQDIEPRTFSFNSPHGACSDCTGLGFNLEPDPRLVIPDDNISVEKGAIKPWNRPGPSRRWNRRILNALAEQYEFSLSTPFNKLDDKVKNVILYGTLDVPLSVSFRTRRGQSFQWESPFEGVIANLKRRFHDTESEYVRKDISRYMSQLICPGCSGKRLRPESLAVMICGINIMDLCSMTIDQALKWISGIQKPSYEDNDTLEPRDLLIANQILKEIDSRLHFLVNVGLDYLTLDRTASTLSGGESQRIRLATQIGSGLTGVLYVCDEPTIGLHPADDDRLITTLLNLRDQGNSVIVVEHDEAVMRNADYIVDMGPGAGENGGEVVAVGKIDDIMEHENSITGMYLSGRKRIVVPEHRRSGTGEYISLLGARENNLRNIDVNFPLGKFICVTGVSGSGKSTLVYEILYKKIAQSINDSRDYPGDHDEISGIELIDKVINIDQSPIGRTPRSNPATYVGAFTGIREIFSQLPESRARGYKPGRFSFNVKGGRCEACSGDGYNNIEMHFLPDVTVPCEICNGARYNQEALEVKFRNHSISDVLAMSVDQALELFQSIPKIRLKLETMSDVGLGYIRLGQPATTLSGGEAQRIKLATELSRRSTGRTLYLLDEPTTGLSFADVAALLKVLHRLVDSGNTVIVVEHHIDVIKNADWIIDLGPGAGVNGGLMMAEGTPEEIAISQSSITGNFLQSLIKQYAET
ncbi:MAG: excinuclease ABC subunit A [Chloroflexi bacterium]|nr:excinuclease ABC subunit A [Chloroflexota bacterium]|tara:strand:- start:18853 stop:21771 length:2919 start_codon:yes stop_codon:yes gene_type:complete